ncbi:hypothetical protein D3C87_1915370 [compost metagenome]
MAERLQRNTVQCGVDQVIDIIRRTDLAQARKLALQLCGRHPATHRQIEVGTVILTQARIIDRDLPAIGTDLLEFQGNHP